MIKLATIGTSSICDSFLQGVKLIDDFKIEAVYSRAFNTGADFAKKHGASKVFTDLEKMAKDQNIDAVYIASPNSCHFLQSKLFLQNKKHVICEKPITTSANEHKQLKRLADENGVIYMEAIISRHNLEYAAIHKALESIGKIKSANIKFHQRSSRLDAFLNGEKVNIFDMSLKAGTLMDIGVYCVYAAVDFFGTPKNITAQSTYLHNGADGTGTAEFDYDSFTAKLSYSKIDQDDTPSVIVGENGILEIDKISQYAGVYLIKDGERRKIADSLTKPQQMSSEAKHFAEYILRFKENEQEYKAVSDLCLKVHKTMDTIKISANLKYN